MGSHKWISCPKVNVKGRKVVQGIHLWMRYLPETTKEMGKQIEEGHTCQQEQQQLSTLVAPEYELHAVLGMLSRSTTQRRRTPVDEKVTPLLARLSHPCC